ncbi:MAG: MBL fold metallo-hydrolase, partial [Caldilineaceae bacterium]|nr:MBL fold metallo-hydrolase [Caldilineaceae bacterium]
NIEQPNNLILLVSFMAQHTLGRRIKDGEPNVRIFGEPYDVRAQVESIDGYSAHADQAGLLHWASAFDRARLEHLFVVHGEHEAAFTLADKLRADGVGQVDAPVRGQSWKF